MYTITLLLTILAILSPILTSSLEPRRFGVQIHEGVLTAEWVEGFIGERPWTSPDGDYLRTIFCYCKTQFDPMVPINKRGHIVSSGNNPGQHSGGGGGIQPGEIVRGHAWRYEYFNTHNNATYWLNHYCLEDAFPMDEYGCGNDGPGGFMPAPDAYFKTEGTWDDWAFSYAPIPGHKLHTWTVYKKQFDADWIAYGRGEFLRLQKRRLGVDQGLIEMPVDWVDDQCVQICDRELLLPIDRSMRSHGEIYNDIDDMCDRCA